MDGEGQDAADAWTEGGGQDVQSVRNTRKPLHRRLLTRHPVGADQDDATANAWEEKNKKYRSNAIHFGRGARFGARGVRKFYAASPYGPQWAVTRR